MADLQPPVPKRRRDTSISQKHFDNADENEMIENSALAKSLLNSLHSNLDFICENLTLKTFDHIFSIRKLHEIVLEEIVSTSIREHVTAPGITEMMSHLLKQPCLLYFQNADPILTSNAFHDKFVDSYPLAFKYVENRFQPYNSKIENWTLHDLKNDIESGTISPEIKIYDKTNHTKNEYIDRLVYDYVTEDKDSKSDHWIWKFLFLTTKLISVLLFYVIIFSSAVASKVSILALSHHYDVAFNASNGNFINYGYVPVLPIGVCFIGSEFFTLLITFSRFISRKDIQAFDLKNFFKEKFF